MIIVQENHAFDNYFGTFPGLLPALSLNMSTFLPVDSNEPDLECVSPLSADSDYLDVDRIDLNHNWTVPPVAYDNGKIDDFVYAQYAARHLNQDSAMANRRLEAICSLEP